MEGGMAHDNSLSEKLGADIERDMLCLLVSDDEDAEGLLAFALHRRAYIDWADAYRAARGAEPDDKTLADFMLGETAERRIRDYRERASLMLAVPPEPAPAQQAPTKAQPPRTIRTWFWPWGFPQAFAPDTPDQPVNWKGLASRLVLLMLAVIVTALLMRFLFVRHM
jgi:hypothetical protein